MPMATLKRWWWVSGTLILACAVGASAGKPLVLGPRSGPPGAAAAAPRAPGSAAHRAPPPSDAGSGRKALAEFHAFVKEQGELDYPDLAKRLGLSTASERSLTFDPTTVRYFAEIDHQLQLSEAERNVFRKQGVVSVDHQQRYSMASAYFAIYARDLPVLVTTDSILHALHRSFDTTLEDLERHYFAYVIDATLSRAADGLPALARDQALRTSAADLDLYFTVARNLLAGGGGTAADPPLPGEAPLPAGTPGSLPPLAVQPRLVAPNAVSEVLAKISSLVLEDPNLVPCTKLYGGERCVDWSQFQPRGHYTHDTQLRRYFRTLMWLGRVDLGFTLRDPDPVSGLRPQVERERRDAALLALLLEQSGELEHLAAVGRIVDFLVGRSDNVTLDDLRDALAAAGVSSPSALAERATLERFDQALDTVGARGQQIRSQIVGSDRGGTATTKLPLAFQVFGQRFVIDSFALSNVVFDSIVYKNEKPERHLPSGLDVMAALGNDLAVRLLEPGLNRYHYASNLLATRRVVDAMQPGDWDANVYNQWLSALRTLDDAPAAKARFPEVMRREAWQSKELRTSLASWAELRHDTILYAKQSYTAVPSCEYPTGFVEPYPAFYAKVAKLAATLADRLAKAEMPATDPRRASAALSFRDRHAAFFLGFSRTVARLEALAVKELASEPFSQEELDFVKKTIDVRGGGSGLPRYDGWYPKLFNDRPFEEKPVVADVHTDPSTGHFLEVGVGDTQFLVVAVDNGPHRAVYVGPSYSYYEFASRTRLTDEQWGAKLDDGSLPTPPAFTSAFAVPGSKRTLDAPPRREPERRPRQP